MFSFGGKNLIAVDIGSSSLKVAELDVSGRGVTLKKFLIHSLTPNIVDSGEIKDPPVVATVLQNMLGQIRSKRKYASTGVWGSAVLVKKITMPQMESKLLAEQIRWEAEQYIPFNINEVAIDYHVLNRKTGDSMEVLLIAAKQEYLFRILEAIESTSLRCAVVDVSGLALANCFEVNYGKLPGVVAILNIGASVINMVVIDSGDVIHARDLPIGGFTYTQEIHKNLGLSLGEAESMKMSAATGKEIPSELNDIIQNVSDQLNEEIRNAFEFVITTLNLNMTDAKVFVTGGTIGVPNLINSINQSLGTNCEILDPFKVIRCDPKEITPEAKQQLTTIGAVTLGLGLRKVVEK